MEGQDIPERVSSCAKEDSELCRAPRIIYGFREQLRPFTGEFRLSKMAARRKCHGPFTQLGRTGIHQKHTVVSNLNRDVSTRACNHGPLPRRAEFAHPMECVCRTSEALSVCAQVCGERLGRRPNQECVRPLRETALVAGSAYGTTVNARTPGCGAAPQTGLRQRRQFDRSPRTWSKNASKGVLADGLIFQQGVGERVELCARGAQELAHDL